MGVGWVRRRGEGLGAVRQGQAVEEGGGGDVPPRMCQMVVPCLCGPVASCAITPGKHPPRAVLHRRSRGAGANIAGAAACTTWHPHLQAYNITPSAGGQNIARAFNGTAVFDELRLRAPAGTYKVLFNAATDQRPLGGSTVSVPRTQHRGASKSAGQVLARAVPTVALFFYAKNANCSFPLTLPEMQGTHACSTPTYPVPLSKPTSRLGMKETCPPARPLPTLTGAHLA